MLKLTKHDLIFLSRLEIDVEILAVPQQGKSDMKAYWIMKVCTNRHGYRQEGILHGARGEERRFLQLNALVRACKDYIPNCQKITVQIP